MTPQSAKPLLPGWADIVATGFGTSVAIWAIAYILRIPAIGAPHWLLTAWIAFALLAGGHYIGRYSRRGWKGGLWAGLLSGLLNLLILGAAFSDAPAEARGALPLFALASLVLSGVLGLLGAAFGNTRRARTAELPNWAALQARVLAAAVFVLLIAGGLVTTYDEGLAVPDWPASFGYNMFLLPLAHMDAHGVFLEHAHRLLGALVGLTALATAVLLAASRLSSKAKLIAWVIFGAICVQGILGGLRVTEQAVGLAGIHGVLAHLIFATTVALAVIVGNRWIGDVRTKASESAGMDHKLAATLVGLLVAQVAIGAFIRHAGHEHMLYLHIVVAVGALALAIAVGTRAWGMHPDIPVLRRGGLGLIHIVSLQVVLGVVAWASGVIGVEEPTLFQALIATLHQANAALLLGWAVRLTLWDYRVLRSEERLAA